MDRSLILPEKHPYANGDIIEFHGRSYFNFSHYSPEESGLYEILVKQDSPYRSLIETRLFIPLFYYDKKEDVWSHGNRQVSLSEYQVLGWRFYV